MGFLLFGGLVLGLTYVFTRKPAPEVKDDVTLPPVKPTLAAPPPVEQVGDPTIEVLTLSPVARTAAYALRKAQPDVIFTSGRRSLAEQAAAMAGNVVLNRQWIAQTYKSSEAKTALQAWVNAHPAAKTKDAIATGLLSVLVSLGDKATAISRHLTGDAFDVKPVSPDTTNIRTSIRQLPGLVLFLEKEGGLVRWHAQFTSGVPPLNP